VSCRAALSVLRNFRAVATLSLGVVPAPIKRWVRRRSISATVRRRHRWVVSISRLSRISASRISHARLSRISHPSYVSCRAALSVLRTFRAVATLSLGVVPAPIKRWVRRRSISATVRRRHRWVVSISRLSRISHARLSQISLSTVPNLSPESLTRISHGPESLFPYLDCPESLRLSRISRISRRPFPILSRHISTVPNLFPNLSPHGPESLAISRLSRISGLPNL